MNFAPTRNYRATDRWTLRWLPKEDPSFAHVPPIRIRHLDARKSFIQFGGERGKKRTYRGAFVDAKTLCAALTGEGHTLESAGAAFGCDLKKSEAKHGAPISDSYLDYCLNDVDLTAELYRKALARYREFGMPKHPSTVYSAASLAKGALGARGVVPPILEDKNAARIMAAFYAGKVECRAARREVADVAVLDFTSEYPSLYCLLGAERFLTAKRIDTRDVTEEVRSFLDSLTVEDLLKKETWANPLMWSLCEVEAKDDLLPVRSRYSAKGPNATIGWNHVTTEPGLTLPYLFPDVVAAKLLGGKTPNVVRSTSFVPVGRQQLNDLSILGEHIGPNDNLIQRLTEARIRERRDKRPGWENRALGLKILVNAGSFGVFVEVNVQRETGEMEILGLDEAESFEEEGVKIEEPGEFFFPLLGVMMTSGAHLLLALLDRVAADYGAEVVYQDTDSAFVTPSAKASEIAARFDGLNPHREPCSFLKNETEDKRNPKLKGKDGARLPVPKSVGDSKLRFFGLSSKRYCLYVLDKFGRPVVRTASDHGLGMYQVPGNREEFVRRAWENVILATKRGERAGEGYSHLPATAQFALTTPALYPRVSKIEGMRPFTFLTIAYKDPAALPKGTETFELLPFASPKDDGWSQLAERDCAKTWEHILVDFAEHHDEKYLLGPDGRIARRSLLVRRESIRGTGKEGGKYAARFKLGRASEAAPSVFVDWRRRLPGIGRTESRRLGLDYRTVKKWKAALRERGDLRGDAKGRLMAALTR